MALARQVGREIARGAKITSVLVAAGITYKMQGEWERKAASGLEPYANFERFLRQKEAVAICRAEQNVHGGGKQWCASARWLEAQDKKTWMRTQRQEHATHARLELMFPDLAAAGTDAAKCLAAETAKRGCGSPRRSIGSTGRRRPGAA